MLEDALKELLSDLNIIKKKQQLFTHMLWKKMDLE